MDDTFADVKFMTIMGTRAKPPNENVPGRSVQFALRLICGSRPWTVQGRGHKSVEVHNHNGNASDDQSVQARDLRSLSVLRETAMDRSGQEPSGY